MKLGTIRGIKIKLHLSTLVIVALVGFYAASLYSNLILGAFFIELILVGILNGFIILGSILLHELMHSFVAQNEGMDVSEIEFYMFGGASKIHEEPETPKAEMKIAVVGPVMSLILGGILLTTLFLIPKLTPIVYVTLFYSGISNVTLGIFNFLPAYPMDGGRVLRSILWKKRRDLISATKTASTVGIYTGYGLIIWGIVDFLLFGLYGGLWLVFIACFLINSARDALKQTVQYVKLSKIKVGDMISTQRINIDYSLSIYEAVRQYFLPYKKEYFPVVKDGGIIGIIDLQSIKGISREERKNKKVEDVMIKTESLPRIKVSEDGNEALNKLREMQHKPKTISVYENSKILGFIGKDEVQSALQFSDIL
jgi:Zn-dependent protease/predicted transcriptional regulator